MAASITTLDAHTSVLKYFPKRTVDMMSTPRGPRESRTDRGRGRGRGRASLKLNERRNEAGEGTFSRRPPNPTRTSDESSSQLRSNARQKDLRGQLWRGDARPARRSRLADPVPKNPQPSSKPRDETWRDSVYEPASSYQKKMNDLYPTVSIPTS